MVKTFMDPHVYLQEYSLANPEDDEINLRNYGINYIVCLMPELLEK